MILFSSQDWLGSLIFIGIFALIVGLPCFFLALTGRKMITQIGFHPSKAAAIQVKYFLPICIIEAFAFVFLLGFYKLFQGI